MRPTTKGMNIRSDQMVAPVRLLVLVHKQASAAGRRLLACEKSFCRHGSSYSYGSLITLRTVLGPVKLDY
jgi:3-deoxy-D-manno-octulosonic acid (KDO) 8-phosphate synthase